jgi:hypothetical protein
VELDVPFVKTTNAVARVEAMDGSVSVSSGAFTLTPQSNVENLGLRGLHSEAIAIRGQYFWATQRGSDSIVKLRLPGLLPIGKESLHMTGITGVVRDMAYDATADLFYMLTGNADYSNAKVYRMDTLGVAQGEVTLPVSSISGITMTAEGLVLITPGVSGKIYVIDPANGSVKSESTALQNAQGDQRAGLEWDGFGFVQGVSNAARTEDFASELQRISGGQNPRVTQFRPVVLPAGGRIVFYGLAYDGSSTPKNYYATDTAGIIYRFKVEEIFSGVDNTPVIETGAETMAIRSITPNPFRGTTEIEYELRNRGEISIDLYSANGMRARQIYTGAGEPGMHRLQLSAETLPSGVYYVSIANGRGERVVQSVVVMK